MKVKTFIIKDRLTSIDVIAIKPEKNAADFVCFKNAGFDEYSIILAKFDELEINHDPYCWNNRTMRIAHLYIKANFDELKNRSTLDVEDILGEKGD